MSLRSGREYARDVSFLLSSLTYIYEEWIFSKALQDFEVSIKMNDRILNNIRYANDTVLVAGNHKDL